ncbi:MAG TPA: DNA polymerase III subunit alpha [Paludibacteraceae bacterium]|nr:DNA polymerase III subunit alpha [Paludibacteraceae bacterium]
MTFTHLHVHSHYSILDGMSKISELVDKCQRTGMNAMALTDHGNMFGIKEFSDYAKKVNSALNRKVKECEEELDKIPLEIERNEKIVASPSNANALAQATAAIERLRARRIELEKKLPELKQKVAEYIPFKPIFGIETYCAPVSIDVRRNRPDRGWHLILLAKNKVGYHNLCKLSSIAYTDGFYYNPRIDYALLEKYHEGLIICSACLGGELPQKIMDGDIDGAEKAIRWFKNLVGDDYYIEIQRHQTTKPGADQEVFQRQQEVNAVLLDLAKKTGTKVVATNDVHFVEEEHGEAHDRLICLSMGKDYDDPDRLRYTKQEWLKTPEEMVAIFADVPEVITNTQEIAEKVEFYDIDSEPIMPKFDIPAEFGTEEMYRQKFTEQDLFDEFTRNEKGEVVLSQAAAEKKIRKLGGYDKLYRIKLEADYLNLLAWKGAKVRYGDDLSDELKERITFELHIMKTMGYPGYFLIVQDYIRVAREELGVSVGPGRGSAAGSVVAYCLKITDIDPLKYDLLFERFLNPDRISLPDIDVDFDDDGRGKVIDWVTQKYGKKHVAHVITYGTMATKSSIADVGRVQKVPLSTVTEVKALIPDNFDDFKDPETGKPFKEGGKKIPKVNLENCFKYVPEIKKLLDGDDQNISSMLHYASELEDTNRQIGIHACGIIIGADDLTKVAPVCTIKDKATDSELLVTQYDGRAIESVGLIKMDFLGLNTLSIIKETLANIKQSKDIDIDIDAIPIDDKLTYKLYSKGSTVAIFQFESLGMQKYLRELRPTVFGDLVAMNALYRPGPMDKIPSFIARKQGREEISYELPCMEKYLKETYGIAVYQEQVMLLSREIADFTRGESDTLRKAMGKKQEKVMEELFGKFMEQGVPKQCKETGKPEAEIKKILEQIWHEWIKFAFYAFNKSHATCYAWLSYQTAYLKAHYPAEFMAANLTRNKDDIKKVTKLMDECKAMRLDVKGPDINESKLNFTVNKAGEIRFGLGGVKGVGEGAVDCIVKERMERGLFTDMFNFVERVNLSVCNRKAIESLVLAGAFDAFGIERELFFATNIKGEQFIETLIRYGNRFQQDQLMHQNSLFGEMDGAEMVRPEIPEGVEWSMLERLNKERELVGIYLSSHPLDRYRLALEYGCSAHLQEIPELIAAEKAIPFTVGGMITAAVEAKTRYDKPFGIITVEDFSGPYKFYLYNRDFIEFGKFMKKDLFVLIHGRIQERGSDWKFKKSLDSGEKRQWEAKITNIELLDDVADKLINKLTITLSLDKLEMLTINELMSLIDDNPGTIPLHVVLEDLEEGYSVPMYSRKKKVAVTEKLLSELAGMAEEEKLKYKVN